MLTIKNNTDVQLVDCGKCWHIFVGPFSGCISHDKWKFVENVKNRIKQGNVLRFDYTKLHVLSFNLDKNAHKSKNKTVVVE